MGYSKLSKLITTIVSVSVLLVGCNGTGTIHEENIQVENTQVDNQPEVVEDEKEVVATDEMLADVLSNIKNDEERKLDCFLEPILQNPTNNSVVVQWFTTEEGANNSVVLYENIPADCIRNNPNKIKIDVVNDAIVSLMDGDVSACIEPTRQIEASTFKMSKIRGGKTDADKYDGTIGCDIYKHVAVVDNLPEYDGNNRNRITYSVKTDENESYLYTLSSNPTKGTNIKVLLSSDHQLKPMVAANIEKVYDTVGNVDAILLNGDLVDVIDSAYNWFYADNAFWRVMTGTASSDVGGRIYNGAALVQEAPIYSALGNHDVMGVYDDSKPLDEQFNNPKPYDFNMTTYTEMLELPVNDEGSESYYATNIGDIGLIALDVNRVWRLPNVGLNGKYSEIPGMGEETYGYGDFIFESVNKDSNQIKFLENHLKASEYQDAKYKVVMFHHEAHSLGSNQVPAFTDPIESTTISPITGQEMVVYEYPIENDYIINVIEPLLEENQTQLLFEAHSHIWNRFITKTGMNVLESSNVGNNYGGFESNDDKESRTNGPSAFNSDDLYHNIKSSWNEKDYVLNGDPNGLTPEYPNKAELPDNKPYLASDTITAFSILDTNSGCVDSYYYDTQEPDGSVVLFDSFEL